MKEFGNILNYDLCSHASGAKFLVFLDFNVFHLVKCANLLANFSLALFHLAFIIVLLVNVFF